MPVVVRQILGAVGRNGANIRADIDMIMFLLNQVPEDEGGPAAAFIKGDLVSSLIPAIEQFQRRQFDSADGRVDVGGKTFRTLGDFDPDPNSPVLLPTTRSGKKSSGGKKSRGIPVNPGGKRIASAVGRNGSNLLLDVRVIKHLFNQIPEEDGGSSTIFVEADPPSALIPAIDQFQRRQFGFADGRVDVGGRTLGRLREFDADPEGPVVLPLIRLASGKKGGRKSR